MGTPHYSLRTIRPSTTIRDILWLGIGQLSLPILCEETSSAWLLLFHRVDMMLCVLLRALLMGRTSWILLPMMWCIVLYILPPRISTNHLPAAFNETFPSRQSILILDNCVIHKMRALQEIVEGFGCVLLFLPPYSPDFNPIKESFSCSDVQHCRCLRFQYIFTLFYTCHISATVSGAPHPFQ